MEYVSSYCPKWKQELFVAFVNSQKFKKKVTYLFLQFLAQILWSLAENKINNILNIGAN